MTTHRAASTVGWNWGRPEEDAMTAAAIDSEGGRAERTGVRASPFDLLLQRWPDETDRMNGSPHRVQ